MCGNAGQLRTDSVRGTAHDRDQSIRIDPYTLSAAELSQITRGAYPEWTLEELPPGRTRVTAHASRTGSALPTTTSAMMLVCINTHRCLHCLGPLLDTSHHLADHPDIGELDDQ